MSIQNLAKIVDSGDSFHINVQARALECSRMEKCMIRKKPKRTSSKQIEAALAADVETEVLNQ